MLGVEGIETAIEFKEISERNGLVVLLEETGGTEYDLWRKLPPVVKTCQACPNFLKCGPEITIYGERINLGGNFIKGQGREGCVLEINGISSSQLPAETHENWRTYGPLVAKARIKPIAIASL